MAYRYGSLRTRVERGARWLDENFSGWESRIDLDTLELQSGESCICGQVFGQDSPYRTDGGRERMYNCGYSYASRTLFAQANSWISTLVGAPVDSWFSYGGHKRAEEVGQALGFYLPDSEFGDYNHSVGSYAGLQKEWKRFLRARARQAVSV